VFQSTICPKVTIIQLRSQIIKGLGFEFTIQLSNWIRDTKFSEVLILTGLDKTRRVDVQLSGY
jgi:predicted ATP-grasp superfamily ATP-dependent carboligase